MVFDEDCAGEVMDEEEGPTGGAHSLEEEWVRESEVERDWQAGPSG